MAVTGRVRGGRSSLWFVMLAIGLGIVLSGCLSLTENFELHGLKRATFELDCPRQRLEIKEIGGREVGVTGCGKRAIYVQLPDGHWVNNTGIESAPSRAEH